MSGERRSHRAKPVADPDVLFADRDFFVVAKPVGIPTTAPAGDSLVARVSRLDARAALHHPSSRLDLEVSGVVVFARHHDAVQALLDARAAARYARRYWALAPHLGGAPAASAVSAEGLVVEVPIGVDPRNAKLRAVVLDAPLERTQPARTTVFARHASPLATSYLVVPHTGRTHQLRVHLAHLGAPIHGDVDYGGSRRIVSPDGRVASAPRVLLHCLAVRVTLADRVLEIHAPPPEDLVRAARELGVDVPSARDAWAV